MNGGGGTRIVAAFSLSETEGILEWNEFEWLRKWGEKGTLVVNISLNLFFQGYIIFPSIISIIGRLANSVEKSNSNFV